MMCTLWVMLSCLSYIILDEAIINAIILVCFISTCLQRTSQTSFMQNLSTFTLAISFLMQEHSTQGKSLYFSRHRGIVFPGELGS